MFKDWLLTQLNERDWTQADLARASGLTRAAISRYVNGIGKIPDPDALKKISKALSLPQEIVFRAAGWLVPVPEEDMWAEKMNHKIGQLTGARREMAERLLDTLLDEQDREIRKTNTAKI